MQRLQAAGLIIVVLNFALVYTACDGTSRNDRTQVVIGLITNNPNGLRNIQGFKAELAALGYVEGETVKYLFAGAPVNHSNLDKAIQAIVEAEADLIFTTGTPTGVAAHRVTANTKVPVVFGVIADPIAAGVIQDLTRPGGNMTGVKLSQSQGRRLELLREMIPDMQRVLVPYNPSDPAPVAAIRQIETVASVLGIELAKQEARDAAAVTALLAQIPDDIDAIFLVPDSIVNQHLTAILRVATEHKLPVSGPSTAQVEEGALTTYGFVHHAVGAQAARMADQILKGADPAELPVETAEFFLAINLVSAAAIGFEIPDWILQQADIIIRGNDPK